MYVTYTQDCYQSYLICLQQIESNTIVMSSVHNNNMSYVLYYIEIGLKYLIKKRNLSQCMSSIISNKFCMKIDWFTQRYYNNFHSFQSNLTSFNIFAYEFINVISSCCLYDEIAMNSVCCQFRLLLLKLFAYKFLFNNFTYVSSNVIE